MKINSDSYIPEKGLDFKVSELSTITTNLVTQLFPMIASLLLRSNPSLVPVMMGLGILTKLLEGFTDSIEGDDLLSHIGEKALLASERGINPDCYNAFQDYLSDIQSIDSDKKSNFDFSSMDKIVTGLAVIAEGLGMKFNLSESTIADTIKMIEADNQYFSSERLGDWLESGKIEEATDYFYDRTGSFTERLEIKHDLLELDIGITGLTEVSLQEMNDAKDRLDNFRFD